MILMTSFSAPSMGVGNKKRGWVQTVTARAKKLKPINSEPRRNSSKKREQRQNGSRYRGRRMAVRGQFSLL